MHRQRDLLLQMAVNLCLELLRLISAGGFIVSPLNRVLEIYVVNLLLDIVQPPDYRGQTIVRSCINAH